MKVKITVELEIPDVEVADFLPGEIDQLVFDAYTHYVTCSHLEDAMKWCANGKIGSDNEDPTLKKIYEYHNNWADISSKAKVKYEYE